MSDDMRLEEVTLPDSPSEQTSAPEDWQSLDGKSQDRFQKLSRMKKEAEERAKRLEEENNRLRTQQYAPVPPAAPQPQMSEAERAAALRLKELDFSTREDVEKMIKEEVQKVEGRNYLESQHMRLEQKFNGADGAPAYDRTEIEQYMRENDLYNPEKAYRDKYYEEIVQLEAKKIAEKQTKQPYSERTRSRASGQEPITPQWLGERLRKPDGKAYYAKNADTIKRLQTEWRRNGVS